MKKLYTICRSFSVGMTLLFSLAIAVTLNQSYAQSVSGSVNDSLSNPIYSGTVELIELQYDTMGFLSPTGISVTAFLNGGNYSFSGVQPGNYWVLANPDDTLYPTALSTYYGNTPTWSTAQALFVDSFGATGNITIITLAPLNGTGTFSGIIQYGTGTGKTGNGIPHTTGDPVPGIDVSLEQIPGGIKAHATTDTSGVYTITNIPLNTTYRLLVDIPGLPMDSSYNVTLSGSNTSAGGLDFVVDTAADGTAGIYIGWPVSTKEIAVQDSEFRIYPNPTNGKFQITNPHTQIQSITIYNILGEKIHPLTCPVPQVGINSPVNKLIDISNQPAGIYFINIKSGENNYYEKLTKQ